MRLHQLLKALTVQRKAATMRRILMMLVVMTACGSDPAVAPDAGAVDCGPAPQAPQKEALTTTDGPPPTVTMPAAYFDALMVYETTSQAWMKCTTPQLPL